MILHSIISMDDIFCRNTVNAPMYKEINGGILELEGNGEEAYVKRLYSTDPRMYLDSRYVPYSKVKNGR